MELWIRSQDKEQLRKIVDLKYQKGTIDDDNIEVILGTTQYDEWEVLGRYKTKERAIEVLDEIQNIIRPKVLLNVSSIKPVGDNYTIENGVVIQKYSADARWEQPDTYVYEMPKK